MKLLLLIFLLYSCGKISQSAKNGFNLEKESSQQVVDFKENVSSLKIAFTREKIFSYMSQSNKNIVIDEMDFKNFSQINKNDFFSGNDENLELEEIAVIYMFHSRETGLVEGLYFFSNIEIIDNRLSNTPSIIIKDQYADNPSEIFKSVTLKNFSPLVMTPFKGSYTRKLNFSLNFSTENKTTSTSNKIVTEEFANSDGLSAYFEDQLDENSSDQFFFSSLDRKRKFIISASHINELSSEEKIIKVYQYLVRE